MRSIVALALFCASAWAGPDLVSLKTVPAEATLQYAGAAQQFLAIATYDDGTERDVTGEAQWRVSNPALAKFTDPARLGVIADGSLTVTAALSTIHAQSSVRIQGSDAARPFRFARDIGGILTKRGCNQAACHGGVKGRGGFKLSANALYPKDDYGWITKGGAYQVLTAEGKGERIPRVDLGAPEQSLLLTKPTMIAPHGGGKRLEKDSEDYKTILAWVKSGAPYGVEDESKEPQLTRLEVFPTVAVMPLEGQRRLLVTARFSDGHTENLPVHVPSLNNNTHIATPPPN